MKRMAGSTVVQVRVPVFGFTCHHVHCVWGSVHPWILKMVCHPCSVWYVKGSVAEVQLMSIGLQISFRLNLIFAQCFSFLCDGWDYRCSWWRFSPVHPTLLHTFFSPAHNTPRMKVVLTSVCLLICRLCCWWINSCLEFLLWREEGEKTLVAAAVAQQGQVFFKRSHSFPPKQTAVSAVWLNHYYCLLLHGGNSHCSLQSLRNDANVC